MNQRAQLWNLLHDGEISGIRKDSEGGLELRIGIPWLREMFTGDGVDILINLHRCTRFEMAMEDRNIITSDLQMIIAAKTDILNVESEDVPVKVVTVEGDLFIDFETFSIFLDTGEPLSFDALSEAFDQYWR